MKVKKIFDNKLFQFAMGLVRFILGTIILFYVVFVVLQSHLRRYKLFLNYLLNKRNKVQCLTLNRRITFLQNPNHASLQYTSSHT